MFLTLRVLYYPYGMDQHFQIGQSTISAHPQRGTEEIPDVSRLLPWMQKCSEPFPVYPGGGPSQLIIGRSFKNK